MRKIGACTAVPAGVRWFYGGLASQIFLTGAVLLRWQFLGGTNMLSGHTDENWKAVRKAVAPSLQRYQHAVRNCAHLARCSTQVLVPCFVWSYTTLHTNVVPCVRRSALQHIVHRSQALVQHLQGAGAGKMQNMEDLLLREAMDVIGKHLLHLCSILVIPIVSSSAVAHAWRFLPFAVLMYQCAKPHRCRVICACTIPRIDAVAEHDEGLGKLRIILGANTCLRAGDFGGFQKEMNALSSLKTCDTDATTARMRTHCCAARTR